MRRDGTLGGSRMKKGLLVALGALALVGCGGGGGGGSSNTDARVTYVNASPDSSTLDFALDGTVKASAVPYGTATAFTTTKPQDDDVSLRATGNSTDLWSESHTFGTDSDNVVVGIGLQNPPTDGSETPSAPELEKRLVLAYTSINRTAPVGNRARIVVVNGFVRQAGDPTPSVDFRNPEDPPTTNATGLAFGGSTSLDLDSGTANYEVRQTGTDQVFVASTPLTLAPGKVYIALISGLEGATDATAPAIHLIPITTRVSN